MVNDGVLAEAAVPCHQAADPLLEPLSPRCCPGPSLDLIPPGIALQPGSPDKERRRFGGAMVVVLGPGILHRWEDPREVRAYEGSECGLGGALLAEEQRGHRKVHHPDGGFLSALPIRTVECRVLVAPIGERGIQPLQLFLLSRASSF